jgi:hypothetical protein
MVEHCWTLSIVWGIFERHDISKTMLDIVHCLRYIWETRHFEDNVGQCPLSEVYLRDTTFRRQCWTVSIVWGIFERHDISKTMLDNVHCLRYIWETRHFEDDVGQCPLSEVYLRDTTFRRRCWTVSIVWGIFDIYDVSGVGCPPVFSWMVAIIVTVFVLFLTTVEIEKSLFRFRPLSLVITNCVWCPFILPSSVTWRQPQTKYMLMSRKEAGQKHSIKDS